MAFFDLGSFGRLHLLQRAPVGTLSRWYVDYYVSNIYVVPPGPDSTPLSMMAKPLYFLCATVFTVSFPVISLLVLAAFLTCFLASQIEHASPAWCGKLLLPRFF